MLSHFHVYTIGYATKSIEDFLSQLKSYKIDVVADVRSVPYSRVFTDYHKENIVAYLKAAGIRYVYLGDELGPRSKDRTHYDETGQVQFHRLMQSPLFSSGIERIRTGLERQFTIGLMCAEKDPATCHRSLLIGYYLLRQSNMHIQLSHILHDGSLETQESLESRLVEIHDTGVDLFMDESACKQRAYDLQLKKTSYRLPE